MEDVRPSRLHWWGEAIGLFVLYQLFEYARTLIVGHRQPAMGHARAVVAAERWLHVYPEPRLNALVTAHKTVAQTMNIYYGTIHFVVPPLVLIWLWRRHPDQYARWRNVLIAISVIALVTFALYPVAPPRLMPGPGFRFIDTSARFGGLGPLDRGNFVDKNPYAAMPSLHLAWATWCAIAVISGSRRRSRWAALLYPAATTLVVIGTANHWVLDVVAGAALAGVGGVPLRRALGRVARKRGILGPTGDVGRPESADPEEVRTHGEIRTPQ